MLTLINTTRKNTMAHITFQYRAEIQARWLMMKSRKTGEDYVILALNYGEALREKINKKHLILNNKKLRSV